MTDFVENLVETVNNASCTFLQTCQTIIETPEGSFCSICYELCKGGKPDYTSVIYDIKGRQCSCNHIEDETGFEGIILDNLEAYQKISFRKVAVFNQFLSHKAKDASVLEAMNQTVSQYIKKDIERLTNQTFKWDDIDIPSIQARYDFIKLFDLSAKNETKIPKQRLPFLNTEPFEKLISLKYLDLITENPDYTFGQPIYNQTLNYYSVLFRYFIDFYLHKDFHILDQIDARDIETYSPISRHYIRQNNKDNAYIKQKYFNEEFNLVKFAIKLVEKFVPGATWRWVGGNHKAHIYCIEICRLIVEYGIASIEECDRIKHALYLKVQVYKSLEFIIDRDAATIDAYWIDVWATGLKSVREYYSEILINILYLHQDNEVLSMFLKIYKESKKTVIKSEEQLKNLVNFNNSVLFEEEHATKTMDFLLNYILSQNQISKKYITTEKLEAIANNFLHTFSNVDDPYLHSLKLIRESDYLNFVQEEFKEFGPKTYIKQDFVTISNELKALTIKISKGHYAYREANILKDFEDIFDKLNTKLSYIKSNQNNDPRNFNSQRLLMSTNLPFIISNMMWNIMEFSDYLTIYDSESLMFKFKNFIEYYLKDNLEMQSSYFTILRFENFKQTVFQYPNIMLSLLYDIFKEDPQILIAKEYMLDILIDIFLEHYKRKKDNLQICDYNDLSKLIDIMAEYINLQCFKIFNWIPEYDIRLALDLTDNIEFLNVEELERLLIGYEGDKKKLDDEKLEFLMNYLSLIHVATSYRYPESIYKKLNENLDIDKLKKLIPLCKDNLGFRSVFIELYSNIHIDFKNHLLDHRSDYYFTKPLDMQYEEDPFYDKFYDKTIDLLIGELKFLIDQYNNLKPNDISMFYTYLNSTIFGNLVKLMNYFLVIKEGDLHKLSKYIPKLEELNDYLFNNRFVILGIYGVVSVEFDSPERKKLEIQMAKIDDNLKIKREKTQVLGHCNAIIEMCKKFMSHKNVQETKKVLISTKSIVSRINETYLKTLNFSNRLQIRKENLSLPFDKLFKKKSKLYNGKLLITKCMVAFYEYYKMTKVSIEAEKNIYLASLNDKDSVEMKDYAKNLCSFIHNQLNLEWVIDKKNKNYTLIESLINALFVATYIIQDSFFNIMKSLQDKQSEVLDKIWIEMKSIMSFVRFKTNVDRFWKEAFRRSMLLIKFHQFLNEDNYTNFKIFFSESKLPNDTIDRVQRWTTIFQKMSDSCNWHYNYTKGDINDFERSHRPYLLPLATGCFENLSELCTGPCFQNQKKVYTYIYDRYNGLLRRFFRDADSEFYRTKLALVDFMLAMIEDFNPDIVNYHLTNFELTNLNFIIVNSLKQLYYAVGMKDPFDKPKLKDYSLTLNDYDNIVLFFESNKKFANHALLNICLKLFGYIKSLGEKKSKYYLYSKERDDLLKYYEKHGEIPAERNITEEDLVTYKFLKKILIKIEIKKDRDVLSYYFAVLSKCTYLTEESKTNFLAEVDRVTTETKLAGILSNYDYFLIEMENNEDRYKNYYLIYKIFGGGKFYYFELVCLIISFINNILLLVDLQNEGDIILFAYQYQNTVLVLGLVEIGISFAAIIAYIFLKYSLQKKLQKKKFLLSHVDKEKLHWNDVIYVNYWLAFLIQKEIAVFLFHILLVSLGLSTTYGLLGIDLFAIVSLSPSMQYIVESVTKHANHILSTLALAAIIIYAYSIFTHLYFLNYFTSDMEGECSNLSHCFFTVLNKGFRNGEGLGGLLNLAYYGVAGGDPRFYGSLFLNISFFLAINTVLLNIILAILVDTFSELRQQSDKFKEDSENVCFICGKQKYIFEKAGIDFDYHTNVEHNIWNYVFFLIFMKNKTEKDCTGIEGDLFNLIKNGQTDWFPIDRSQSLEKKTEYTFTVSLESIAFQNDKLLKLSEESNKAIMASAQK